MVPILNYEQVKELELSVVIPKGTKISGVKTTPDKPVAYLVHEATRTNISVYKPINVFQRCMIRICFGLRYVKV